MSLHPELLDGRAMYYIEIPAVAYGPYAVHRTPLSDWYTRRFWTLTHKPTGRSIVQSAHRDRLIRMAKILATGYPVWEPDTMKAYTMLKAVWPKQIARAVLRREKGNTMPLHDLVATIAGAMPGWHADGDVLIYDENPKAKILFDRVGDEILVHRANYHPQSSTLRFPSKVDVVDLALQIKPLADDYEAFMERLERIEQQQAIWQQEVDRIMERLGERKTRNVASNAFLQIEVEPYLGYRREDPRVRLNVSGLKPDEAEHVVRVLREISDVLPQKGAR